MDIHLSLYITSGADPMGGMGVHTESKKLRLSPSVGINWSHRRLLYVLGSPLGIFRGCFYVWCVCKENIGAVKAKECLQKPTPQLEILMDQPLDMLFMPPKILVIRVTLCIHAHAMHDMLTRTTYQTEHTLAVLEHRRHCRELLSISLLQLPHPVW